MFARKGLFSSIGRTAVMATVAAVALTVVEPSLTRWPRLLRRRPIVRRRLWQVTGFD